MGGLVPTGVIVPSTSAAAAGGARAAIARRMKRPILVEAWVSPGAIDDSQERFLIIYKPANVTINIVEETDRSFRLPVRHLPGRSLTALLLGTYEQTGETSYTIHLKVPTPTIVPVIIFWPRDVLCIIHQRRMPTDLPRQVTD